MQYTSFYPSKLGKILLACDEIGLIGLWFEGERLYAHNLDREHEDKDVPIIHEAKRWLDYYFSGQKPDFMPPLHMIGSDFQRTVWELLIQIPYGETTTYGELAKRVAQSRGQMHMSAQAIGGAVGHNEISIIVPCHRVVGTSGSLTGYAGGIERKQQLLILEGTDMSRMFDPPKARKL